MSQAHLYLIPSPLGDAALEHILPSEVIQIVARLTLFFVEKERTARRYLKQLPLKIPLQAIELHELEKSMNQPDIERYIARLCEVGEGGVLSEAGLPCIADPGSELVALAHERGVKVVPFVGPSSLLLALMASGMTGQHFEFHGYLPQKKEALQSVLSQLEADSIRKKKTQIFIETPYRNKQLFSSLCTVLKPSTKLALASALTTASERIVVKRIKEWRVYEGEISEEPMVFLISC